MRDDLWLQLRFDQMWTLFFPDVERKDVGIRWMGTWKNKFGHIKRRKHGSEIVINKLFKDMRVPEDIIKLTIAHEITHYMHGFQSHLPQQYDHPHQGGVVDKVLKEKGFGYALKMEKKWYREKWLPLYKELCPHKSAPRRRPRRRGLFRFF